ncbi:exodeoxyribonuclease VII large subunit [uncultured Ruminococcus sp.]|uniref:exodeoxyribonuclease VII large subunit n=1 Tax=uncultured Ruminococcus sp. TaxID=165186 RepID=UPI0025F27621|nr:exodeoxyribonuclease VII large subunit [uncultured Ruminococcus sp.]
MSSVLTVSQLNRYVSFKIKSDLKLKGIAVKGEISNFNLNYRSGHAYFTVKDKESAVKAVMFSSNASKLKFIPENGMSVLVVGNLEVYERDGVYQIVVTELMLLGAGAVHDQLQALKEKLKKMGVFDISAKRTITAKPKKIAVVTSQNGAALQDIINIIQRRYPVCELNVFPALVQGAAAPKSIADALLKADNSGADTLILARGGGSDEDLMAFNTESVAMAVFNCKTPVISAVGHETDTTLADYAADMRAPTPSAAAELAVPDMQGLINNIEHLKRRLSVNYENLLRAKENELNNLTIKIKSFSPANIIKTDENRLDFACERLNELISRRIELLTIKIDSYVLRLNALSPFNVLSRGYAIVEKNGEPVMGIDSLKSSDTVTLRLDDGEAAAVITDVKQLPKGGYK